jgi:hypothetical protein
MTNLQNLSDIELDKRIVFLCKEVANIKTQVDSAKSASCNGEYSDPTWFRAATHAMRMKNISLQEFYTEKRRRKQQEKEYRCSRFERIFTEEAKRLLPDDVYKRLLDSTFFIMDH